MCCSGAKWKREVVQDHKFDFVDVHEYRTTSLWTRLQYIFVYVLVIKSVLVYVSDVYTAIAMLANDYWSGNILAESNNSSTIKVPFTIGKWIFTGCIIFSFLLLLWESRKARMIIRSRDISYAFTNVMANNYYSLKSYDHFCFFSQINNSKKKKDEFAFFVFFTFKGWKRLLLADAPRQVINALTLYSFGKAFNFTTDLSKYYNDDQGHFSIIRAGVLCTMIFTVVIWCGSAILLAIAAVMYVPLLCYIQGNLKEYCCHKIDKRIAELMKRKTKKRIAREAELAKREAAGDFRHLQDRKGRFKDGHAPLPQPTLPTIKLGDDDLYTDSKSEVSGIGNSRYGSTRRPRGPDNAGVPAYSYPNDIFGAYPPGMPAMPDMPYMDSSTQDQYGMYSNGGVKIRNDSLASFNDDKLSIASKDPLMQRDYYGQDTRALYGHSRNGSRDALSDYNGAVNASEMSLRAPSYRTREEEDPNAAAYDGTQSDYPPHQYQPQRQNSCLERSQSQPHMQQQHVQEDQYGQAHALSPTHSISYGLDGAARQRELSMPGAPSRQYSMAGQSDITTAYFAEDHLRDRQSMADSQTGAFDLDDYARQSIWAQYGQNPQRLHEVAEHDGGEAHRTEPLSPRAYHSDHQQRPQRQQYTQYGHNLNWRHQQD